MLAPPDRLEYRIRKTERDDVLQRLLGDVVVDAEDLLFLEELAEELVEASGMPDVVAEGLLDEDARPASRA